MTTSIITFNELLYRAGADQHRTLIVRHRPYEPALRKVFPWIVAERPDLFLAYQRSQWRTLEAAMMKADTFISFVGMDPGSAVFSGAYRIAGHEVIGRDAFWAIPENLELRSYGMTGMDAERSHTAIFDLRPTDLFGDLIGRLVVEWASERSWWRWADRNTFPVVALNEESKFEIATPPWTDLVLTWAELATLPRSWRDKLSQWRGIYFIYDVARGKGYVGSAYGSDNILGRWRTYAASGHGGNKQLRLSNPVDLRFSVLERTSPDLDPDSVIRLEAGWKTRLQTRQFGLNEN